MNGVLRGVYRLADPKITLASVASMAVGLGAALGEGAVHWGWFVLTVLGVLCIEAAKNASGEIFDWDSGTDRDIRPRERTPFSGGKRVIVDGLLTRRRTVAVAWVSYGAGAAAGLVLVLARATDVLWFGVVGCALAYFYHAPPARLSYRGLGELAVAISYGPIIAGGTCLVQLQHWSWTPVLASLPLGVTIAAFLWVNELPDRRADAAVGKRTLVVRLGAARAAQAFTVLVVLAYALLAALSLAGLPRTLWFGAIGLPHGLVAARRVRRDFAEPGRLVPAQQATLLSFLLLALGTALGLAVGP